MPPPIPGAVRLQDRARFERLAAEYRGDFLLATVDADREPQIVQHFGVRSLPTVLVVFPDESGKFGDDKVAQPGIDEDADSLHRVIGRQCLDEFIANTFG